MARVFARELTKQEADSMAGGGGGSVSPDTWTSSQTRTETGRGVGFDRDLLTDHGYDFVIQ